MYVDIHHEASAVLRQEEMIETLLTNILALVIDIRE